MEPNVEKKLSEKHQDQSESSVAEQREAGVERVRVKKKKERVRQEMSLSLLCQKHSLSFS